MHLKRGKIVFSKRDCWDMGGALDVIIHSALVRFKSELDKEEFKSYPSDFDSIEEWYEVIAKMVYAFGDDGPDIMTYDFDFIEGPNHGQENSNGCLSWDMVPNNPEEFEAYREAEDEHYKKVEEVWDRDWETKS